MNEKKDSLSAASNAYASGKISRRKFLLAAASAGLALGGASWFASRDSRGINKTISKLSDELSDASASHPHTRSHQFLREIGKSFKGVKLRVLSEDTPPSKASQLLVKEEFSKISGIEVEWTMKPLDKVFAEINADNAREAGYNDIVYIDQSWLGWFSDSLEPIEPWLQNRDLAYPDWQFDDFMAPIVKHTASFKKNIIAVPYDITLFIAIYRKDIFDKLAIAPPTNLDEWMRACRTIQKDYGQGIYGTTGQWKTGHYSLQCNMTAWLWGHGGSIYYADGSPAIADEQAEAAMAYMLELGKYMPPSVTHWDWHGESKSFAQGKAGLYSSWAENFPSFENPETSLVAGLIEPLPMPRPYSLRPEKNCGFEECPGMSHQGGSSLGISRFSKNKQASWAFLQWLTSADVVTRSCLLGGGASATRYTTYNDPRITRRETVQGPSTTRYFPVMKDAILNQMGTEPHIPKWAQLSVDVFAVEIGKMVTHQQDIKTTLSNMAEAAKIAAVP